jgi:hypothetical protein
LQTFREKFSRLSLNRFLRKQLQCPLSRDGCISQIFREGCARANVAEARGLAVEEGG